MAFGDTGTLNSSGNKVTQGKATGVGFGSRTRPAPAKNGLIKRESILDIAKRINPNGIKGMKWNEWGVESRSDKVFRNIDTMLSKDRFSAARSFYDSAGTNFNFNQNEVAGLINAGVLAYGKTSDTSYRVPTVGLNVNALDQFLRDNYKQNAGGGYARTPRAKKRGLEFSDTFFEKAAGSKAGWDTGRRDLNPSQPAALLDDAPKRSTISGEEYDYSKMAGEYLKDQDTYGVLKSKILKKIASEGGSGLLQKIQAEGATPDNIAALQEYMYSPRGLYGKAQMRWVDETFFGGAGAEAAANKTRAAADQDQLQYLYDERVKEQAKLEKDRRKDIENSDKLYFNTDPSKGAIVPKTSWLNNAVALTTAGTGDMISTTALNEIFYSDVMKGTYKNLSDSQKQAVYSSVVSALMSGLPVHPFMYSRALSYEEELKQKALLPEQVKMKDAAKAQMRNDFLTSDLTKAIGSVPGIGPVVVATGLIGGETAEDVNSNFEQGGPLSSTPLSEGFSLASFGGNALKSGVRATISMPQGVYYAAADPVETSKAVLKDYAHRYGSLQGFADSSYEDPLAPVMDALSVLSFAGTATKAAQVARIAAAAKAGKIASKPGKIDMGAYNAHIENWLNTPENLRGGLQPPSAFAGPPETISVREAARIARKAALGDERSAMELGLFLPNSDMALNSAYVPTIMDRAAAFFEPRYRVITQQEGAPARKTAIADETIQALQETVPAAPRAARIRFAGNPLSRGAQKAFFYTQRQVGKTPGKIPQIMTNLPGGYSFRFTRALREGDPAVLDLHAREMIYNRMFQELFEKFDLNDAEMMAVMNHASGEMYSPANLRTIAFNRTERAKAAGASVEEDPLIGMADEDYKLFSDPSFNREFESAMREMYPAGVGPRTLRGEQLLAAAENMILLREKTSHLINHSWDDSRATRAMQLRYQLAMEAAQLMPEQVFDELGKRVDRIAIVNPAMHLYEINRMDVLDLPNERGVPLRDTEGVAAEDLRAIADQVEAAIEYLRKDLGNRTKGGTPVLVIEREFPSLVGDRDFVIARRVRVDGYVEDASGRIVRDGLLDKQELLLPKEFFVTFEKGKKKGRIQYWDNKKENTYGFTLAQERLNELILNEMEAMYPNARDFTDKVSSESLTGRESYAEKRNFNKAVASGLLSFRYQEQIAAHKAAVDRRFNRDINELINSQAEIIALQDFDPNSHVILRTAKVYEERAAAERKLASAGENGINIEEVTRPDGSKAYVVNLNYFDITAATLKEMRLRRILDWDNDVKDAYFERIDQLKTEDPSQAVVVVPKYFAENVGATYKRSQKLAAKILDSSTDIFKVLTLSLNPRFVPQQVIGSSVMLMLAYPEKSPGIMAKVFEYSARQAHGKIGKLTKGESAEYLNHSSDFHTIEEFMPRDVTENVYQQDMLQTAEKRLPSKAMRYMLNSGYIIAFAWERNLRVAIARKLAMEYPEFARFARSKEVRDFAEGNATYEGMSPSMYKTESPFSAAFRLKADPESPFYDPEFLREVRHGTDMVAGNYRDFTGTERFLRNFLMPFYAWTRHSALFTKRMVQERPLTSNGLYWLGNYGYDKTIEAGGLPEWLLESLPMPQFLENILDLNPLNDNRLSVSGVVPFGTFGQSLAAGSNLLFGHKYGSSQATDFLNPFMKSAIEQATGKSLLTGAPVDDSRGLPEFIVDGFQGFPVVGAVVNLFKNESQLNGLRGLEKAEDILVDAEDPNSKLSIPAEKLSTKFETDSPTGVFNLFSPVRAFSLDPEGMAKMVRSEYKKAGIRMPDAKSPEYVGVFETINRLQRWKRKRDVVMNIWWPEYAERNPELAQRVQDQLVKEFPSIPKSTPPGLVERVLNGYVTLPGGD